MLQILRYRHVWPKCHLTRLYTQKVSIGHIGADLQKEKDKMQRIRPLGQPPKVWKMVEKMKKNGKLMKFTIQEIPEDRYEDAIQHMCTYLLADEPMCKWLNAKNDPLFVQDISMVWRLLLAQGISIAAFTDDPNGGKSIIACMNVLGVDINQKDSISSYQFKSEKFKMMYKINVSATKVVYERYGVDKYLYGFGLSTDPEFRRYGLSKDIMKSRNLIGPMYGVPATCSAFTSIIPQKSVAGERYEEFSKQNVSDLVDEDGKKYFPGFNSEMYSIMGKRLL